MPEKKEDRQAEATGDILTDFWKDEYEAYMRKRVVIQLVKRWAKRGLLK